MRHLNDKCLPVVRADSAALGAFLAINASIFGWPVSRFPATHIRSGRVNGRKSQLCPTTVLQVSQSPFYPSTCHMQERQRLSQPLNSIATTQSAFGIAGSQCLRSIFTQSSHPCDKRLVRL